VHPILFRLALPGTQHALTIYSYGAMMCLGFLSAILVAAWRARSRGQSPDVIYNAGLIAFVCGVFGARLFYVVQYHGQFFSAWDLLKIWEGGLTYYGGLVLGAVGVVAYLGLSRRPVLYWLDIIAPSLALGLAFGRMGCFLNGCCYGDASHLPWAFAWPVGSLPWEHYANAFLESSGLKRAILPAEGFGPALGAVTGCLAGGRQAWTIHPSQLYSLVNAAGLFAVLHLAFRWKRRHGQIFFFFILLYAVSRFLLEYTRADETETYLVGLPTLLRWLGHGAAAGNLGGLTISQNVAAAMAAAAVAALVWLNRSTHPHRGADYEPSPDKPIPAAGSNQRKGKRR